MDIKNIIIGILVVSVALTSIAFAYKDTEEIPIIEPKEDSKATIRVSGDSLIKVKPDISYVYIKIETEGYTAEEAKKENNKISGKVMDSLSFLDISNIETDSFWVNEKDPWREKETSEKKYTATNILKITIKDLDKIGKVIDKAINNGAMIERISYELSEDKEKEVKKKVLKEASENAYEKALAIAEGLNKELEDLVSIEESNFYYRAYEYGLIAEMAVGDTIVETEILPEDLEVTAYVTLVYEVK